MRRATNDALHTNTVGQIVRIWDCVSDCCVISARRRRALDREIQHVLIIQQARDAPGCQLTYAVARHHQRARYLGAQHGPGRNGLGAQTKTDGDTALKNLKGYGIRPAERAHPA